MRRLLLTASIVALSVAMVACFGPKPTVLSHELEPPAQAGQPWVMRVTVENRSRGSGQIAITVRLRDPDTGAVLAQDEATPELRGHQTITVAIELRPAGDGPFREEVDAEYPT